MTQSTHGRPGQTPIDTAELDSAIAAIRNATPQNDPWTAEDIWAGDYEPREVDRSIATILNAVVSGGLVRARRKAEAWQPIETAPLGQNILVFRPAMWGGKGHIGVAKWNTDEYAKCPKPFWESCEGWIGRTEDRAYPPTHWRPLPAPPATTEAEGGSDAE